MPDERELLESAMQRLGRAIERGTGTSFDADEVKVLGSLLRAVGTAALGGAASRSACAICGRPEHRPMAIDNFARHPYQPGVLVPLGPPQRETV